MQLRRIVGKTKFGRIKNNQIRKERIDYKETWKAQVVWSYIQNSESVLNLKGKEVEESQIEKNLVRKNTNYQTTKFQLDESFSPGSKRIEFF